MKSNTTKEVVRAVLGPTDRNMTSPEGDIWDYRLCLLARRSLGVHELGLKTYSLDGKLVALF